MLYQSQETTRHKVFISFYHSDDQRYKNQLDLLLGDTVINKSVMDGEYDPNNSDEYVKRLIREDKVSDTSVMIVLVGPNTRRRKHVDWEIYAALSGNINGSSGLVGVILPSFPLLPGSGFRYADLPQRLADNVKSGYAKMYSWDDFQKGYERIIEEAYSNRISLADKIDNRRHQMQYNLGWNE